GAAGALRLQPAARTELPVDALVEVNRARGEVYRGAVHIQLVDSVPFSFAQRDEDLCLLQRAFVLENYVAADDVAPVGESDRLAERSGEEVRVECADRHGGLKVRVGTAQRVIRGRGSILAFNGLGELARDVQEAG